jgi:2-succinyl-5-enolpyruvyl-6-hydroxy-3-cyclohexene-1-carboxylate synthase
MSTAKANQNSASRVASVLVERGVRHVVLSPGSRNTPLVLAFHAHPKLRCHSILDERAAGFIALGLARESGNPVALCCTSGSAAAHYFPAIIEASHSHIPLVVLTADRPPERQGIGEPQTIDQREIFGSYVRFFAQCDVPEPSQTEKTDSALVHEALSAALSTPKGPIHLNHPFREPLWESGAIYVPLEAPPMTLKPKTEGPSSEMVSAIATTMEAHEKGVLLCGPRCPGAKEDPFPQAITALAQHLQWPIFAEPSSGLRYGNHNTDTIISSYDAILRCEDFAEEFQPDFVIQIGGTLASRACRQWAEQVPMAQTLLVDPGVRWNREHSDSPLRMDGDPSSLCSGLLEHLRAPREKGWVREWNYADAIATEQAMAACGNECWEGSIARTLLDTMPTNSIVHVGSSMPIRDLDAFTATHKRPIRVHANRGANGIDGIMSTALGENLASPHIPALALMGDLTFLHDSSGVLTAATLAPNLTVVVIDNGGGGIFEFLPISQMKEGFESLFITPQKTPVLALAQAAGGHGRSVEDWTSFADMLREEIARPGLSVIEVKVDRADNVRRHQDLWEEISEVLEQWLENRAGANP